MQKNLTQAQLAEKLNIADKAISKWERGLLLPDSSIMPECIYEDMVSGRHGMKNRKKKVA